MKKIYRVCSTEYQDGVAIRLLKNSVLVPILPGLFHSANISSSLLFLFKLLSWHGRVSHLIMLFAKLSSATEIDSKLFQGLCSSFISLLVAAFISVTAKVDGAIPVFSCATFSEILEV